jgi:hypothetical protein
LDWRNGLKSPWRNTSLHNENGTAAYYPCRRRHFCSAPLIPVIGFAGVFTPAHRAKTNFPVHILVRRRIDTAIAPLPASLRCSASVPARPLETAARNPSDFVRGYVTMGDFAVMTSGSPDREFRPSGTRAD